MGGTRTRVVLVGGGPAGLILAIELAHRGVPCIPLGGMFQEPGVR